MQSSFWKTVGVVGVIGIGSLAILEVQHRLSQSNEPQVSAEDEALAEEVVKAGEKSVDAKLSQSEFERLLSGGEDDKPKFDLSEPNVAESDNDAFFGSELVEAQPNTPAPSTEVDVRKASSENPFLKEEAVTASTEAAETTTPNFEESADTGIQPVGFIYPYASSFHRCQYHCIGRK